MQQKYNLVVESYEKDTIELKQMGQALRSSEIRFRALFEQAGGYCMILDPNTEDGIPLILDANIAACESHGYTREEFIGRSVADIDNEDGKKLVRERTALIMTGKPFYVENIHIRKDGTSFLVAVNAKRIDIENELPLILTTEYNITKKKKTEEELKKHKDHLEEMVVERTKELAEKNKELENYNQLFIGREFRIKELRDKIKVLEKDKFKK